MSTIELPVLVLNPHMALAQTAEAQRPKVDVPDPVVDLLEADVFADADRGDVDPAAVPPHAPVGADVPDFEAVRVLEGRQPIRHRPRRRAVTRRRRLLVERLMGPLVIELLAEDVEAALLRRETARGRPGRLRFQRAMHPFMPAVLIRAPGLDELRQDPEADPPRRELRQARQRGGGERHAVVAANPPRQPILVELAGKTSNDRIGRSTPTIPRSDDNKDAMIRAIALSQKARKERRFRTYLWGIDVSGKCDRSAGSRSRRRSTAAATV